MKKFLLLILICFAQNIFSQTEEVKITSDNINNYKGQVIEEENQVYNTAGIEVRPEFPGGPEKFDSFIKQNYKTPNAAVGLKGRIYMTFIVEIDGSLSNIKILRDLGLGTGQEAIRVLKTSPKWTPGMQNNKQVRVQYSTPISINP